jgi:hypothetical protein
VPIWNKARHKFLEALAVSSANGGTKANDSIVVSGNTVRMATQKALDLLPVVIRLDFAARYWGRYAEGSVETVKSVNLLIAVMRNAEIVFADAATYAITPEVLEQLIFELESVYARLEKINAPFAPSLPKDDKLFDPLGIVEEVANDLEQLALFLDDKKDAMGNNNFKIRYWRKGAPTPDYDDINADISRILNALGATPTIGRQEIPVPNIAKDTTFLNLNVQMTKELFAKGATEGSIATKLGFAIQRENALGDRGQYLVQRIQEFDYRLGVQPASDLLRFRVPVGWTVSPPVNSWWALSVFLQKYADFLHFMLKVLRVQDYKEELEAVEKKLYDANIGAKRQFADNLELWLLDNYQLGRPSSAARTVPDGKEQMVVVKIEPNNSAILNLATYIDADKTSDSWDSDESAEVRADVTTTTTTTAAVPPNLGDTDWSSWE